MKRSRQPIWILTLISLVSAGTAAFFITSVIASTNATPRISPAGMPSPVAAAQASPTVNKTRVVNQAAQSPSAKPTADESGQIPDDATVAPDPQESADNNVSFPNDI